MSPTNEALGPRQFSIVCGAGGSRAILGSSGAILACHLAGIEKWHTIGGASGGSIPTAMLASGMHPAKIARLVIEVDFTSKLVRRGGIFQVILAYFLRDTFYRLVRPTQGLFATEKLGAFVDEHVPSWPKNFWTVAVAGKSQMVFSHEGATLHRLDGTRCLIANEPPSVGMAIRATSAVPGVFDAVRYKNCDLFDGALSIDGRTPVGLAKKHFGLAPETIITVDVGDQMPDTFGRHFFGRIAHRIFWNIICGGHCPIEGEYPVRSEGTILVRPDPPIPSLKFDFTAAEKWVSLMVGFIAGAEALEKAGVLSGARLDKARDIIKAYDDIRNAAVTSDQLAAEVEALLLSHGLC